MISDIVSIPNDSNFYFDRHAKNSDSHCKLREFLVGPENQALLETFSISNGCFELAHDDFNPIVIHGRVGSGKTHFLEVLNLLASGNYSTSMLDTNLFSSECSKSAKLGEIESLVKKLVRVDFLFFDDIHQLQSKPFAQQQLGYIIEARCREQKPSILTAKLSPNRLEFNPFLKSRLSPGLAIRLKAPSKKTRFRIINSLALQLDISISNEAAQLMASMCHGTADQLNRAILAICSQESNRKQVISIEQVCAHFKKSSALEVEPKRIIRETAKHYGLKVGDLVGTSRRKQNVTARSVAIYLVRRLTEISFQEIGKLFGNRDHSTVVHAYRKINSMKKSEPHTRDVIIRLSEKLAS